MSKIYTIVKSGRRSGETSGTLEELCDYFGVKASTIKSLVSKVQRSYEQREASCYERTFVDLKKEPKS